MSVEQFKNRSVTTLNGTITSGATSLVVTDSTQLPASGPFRIGIDNEIIMVSSISGSTCTIVRGQEGTSAAGHTNGATITHFLTAGGLQAYVKGITSYSINVQDFGAKGDGVTDDSAAIQAAINAVPITNPFVGATVYFPHGRYYIATGLSTVTGPQGLRLLGEGAASSGPELGGHGSTEILVGSQQIGYQHNTANASSRFASFSIENLMFAPVYLNTSGSFAVSGTLNTGAFDASAFPTSGTAWIQDNSSNPARIGKITYSAKTQTTLTVTSITNEFPSAGQTYASSSIVAIDALGGVKAFRTSNIRLKAVTFNNFNNQTNSAFGWYNDGSADISQYNVMHDVWINNCYIGAKEDTSSSRWVQCNIDGTKAGQPLQGTTGYLGINARTTHWTNCTFQNHDTLVSVDGTPSGSGQQMLGCRFESWFTRALLVANTQNFNFSGGSFTNSLNGSVGNAVELGSGVDSAVIRFGRISNVAHEVFCTDATSTALIEYSGNGSPEGVKYATAGSLYFQSNATAPSARRWFKTTDGTLNTGWKIMSPNDAPRLRRTYVSMDGLATSRWTTPQTASFDITGLIDLQAHVLPATWKSGSQIFVAKWTASTNNRSYQFAVNSTGKFQFQYSADGSATTTLTGAVDITTFLPYLDTPVWIRCLANPSGGPGGIPLATFFFSTNGTNWFQFDSVSGGVAGDTWAVKVSALGVSGQAGAGTNPLSAGTRLYRGRVYNGNSQSGGTLVASFDATNMEVGNVQPYTDAQSNVWTGLSTAAITADAGNELEIRSSNTSLKDVLYVTSGIYNIKHFGAVGDGVTDDTAAFTACFAAIPNATGADPAGWRVIVPKGTYIISSTLTIPSKCQLVGISQTISRIQASPSFPANTPMIVLGGADNTGSTSQQCRVETMAIDGANIAAVCINSTQTQEESGAWLVSCRQFTQYGILLGAYYNAGVYTVGPSGGIQNSTWRGLQIQSWASTALDGMRIDQAGSRMLVEDVTVNSPNKTTTTGSQTSPPSGSYSLLVGDTSLFLSSGTIFADNQAITYTSKDSTHFLGCTGGYSHTYPASTPVGISGTVGIHMTTNAGSCNLIAESIHIEGTESGIYTEAGTTTVIGFSGHAVQRWAFRNGSTNTSRWHISGYRSNQTSGGVNPTPIAMQDDNTGISYTPTYCPTTLGPNVPNQFVIPKLASAPATPPAGFVALYMFDNGVGKTQLQVKWDSGDITILATEP